MNVSPIIGVLVSRSMATLHELGTVYGVQDAHDLMEIMAVDEFNRAQLRAANQGA